jgi:hypothetical protein
VKEQDQRINLGVTGFEPGPVAAATYVFSEFFVVKPMSGLLLECGG